jgi:hypothetical protein
VIIRKINLNRILVKLSHTNLYLGRYINLYLPLLTFFLGLILLNYHFLPFSLLFGLMLLTWSIEVVMIVILFLINIIVFFE